VDDKYHHTEPFTIPLSQDVPSSSSIRHEEDGRDLP
jgi:hypothetical protein